MNRVVIGATSSDAGKTTFGCGLLKAIKNRGVDVCAFKCGPDYIDPMFHRKVLGIPSRNLDIFFKGEGGVNYLLHKNAENHDLAVVEGVMGYYDGLALATDVASTYDLAKTTASPAILLVDGRGKSTSLIAEIEGFLHFRTPSHIKGIVINRITEMTYMMLKPAIEKALDVEVLGFLPEMDGVELESRHLGLVTADEVIDLGERIEKVAAQVEESVDIDSILNLASDVPPIDIENDTVSRIEKLDSSLYDGIKIAVAMDKAFCFYYEDNLDLLRELGATIELFSPLAGDQLPKDASGLIIGGGYPELYGKELEKSPTTNAIRQALEQGLPCIAESGGFLYLHDEIEQKEGQVCRGAGVFKNEKAFYTGRLQRFGYINLKTRKDSIMGAAGTQFKGHEFHYWDSTNSGEDCHATKPFRKKSWNCIIARENIFAGFPHLHFYSNPQIAKNFLESCKQYRLAKEGA